jgi:hypothetical protein
VVKAGARYATRTLRSTHDFIIGGFAESLINNTAVPVPADEGRESVRVLGVITKQLDEAKAKAEKKA